MKLIQLFEDAATQIQQPKLWHLTEKSSLAGINEEGMLLPMTGKRGPTYKGRIYFFTTLNPHVFEEIEALVRFGGVDMEDEDIMAQREEVPLVLLELDVNELKEVDEQVGVDRHWFLDDGVSEHAGVWTNIPIPADCLKVVRTI